MAETQILDGYIATDKHKYVPMRTAETTTLQRAITRKDVALGSLMVVCLYLLNGAHADKACALITSVPAAIFTYQVLINPNASRQGYHAILFYWSLYGVLAIFDAFFQDSYGYFFGKFIIMAAVFGNAAHSNKDVLSSMTGEEENVVLVEKMTPKKQLTSIVSRYDSEGYPIESPVPSAFSQDGSSVYMESTFTACPIHSAADDMMSTQQNTSQTIKQNSDRLEPTAEGRTSHGINRVLTKMNSLRSSVKKFLQGSKLKADETKIPYPDQVDEDFPVCETSSASTAHLIDGAQPDDSRCTVGVQYAYGDIITNPMEQITLNTPGEAKTITAVNVSTENIMWALKSNALNCLGAAPACGVIPSGGKVTIRVILHEGLTPDNHQNDKLAIDYVKVGNATEYTTDFVSRLDKKRHMMKISYKV